MVTSSPKKYILSYIKNLLEKNEKGSHYICASSVHGIIESQKDHKLKEILNNACVNYPDGLPLAKMGQLLGVKQMEQIKGPFLFPIICEITSQTDVRHFFYGGKKGIADNLADNMVDKYPSLKVAGTYCPTFRELSENEKDEIAFKINSSMADIVWVGLSTPKQEKWAADFQKRLKVKLIFTVGAAFDFHTGNINFAPPWICKIGFEWLFRLVSEPNRLWPRYSRIVPKFILLSLLQLTGINKY